MNKWWICVLALGLAFSSARAEDSAAAAGNLEALKTEFEAARKKYTEAMTKASQEYQAALKEAKTDEEKEEARKKFVASQVKSPVGEFAKKFLDYAKANPGAKNSFEALDLALRSSGGPSNKDGVFRQTLAVIKEQGYATKPDVERLLKPLAIMGEADGQAFVNEVMTKNGDHKIQALAAKALQSAHERTVNNAKALESNEAARANMEKVRGKEAVEKMIADSKDAQKKVEEIAALIKEKYSDIFPDLSIGAAAPELVVPDLDGKAGKLSERKGKVVVLDIWATWCGPCRAMIPHEREMVERLKDKPFELISISADAEKKTLTEFLEKTPMPWTHWWAGNQGGMMDTWNIQYFPTIYVIDSKGVIRHKDLRGEKLEEAVNNLLKDVADKK